MNGGETGVDCGGPCVACGGACGPSLAAYWPMDESGGPRLDASGHGMSLDETNGLVGTMPGMFGGAAHFTGTSLLSIPPARFAGSSLDLSAPAITFAGWMRFDTEVGGQMIGHFRHCVSSHYGLRVTRPPDVIGYGGIEASVYPSYTTTAPGTITADGSWHHYAATYDAASLMLYLDGAQIAVKPYATGSIQNPAIGNIPFTVGGWIDVNGECATAVSNTPVHGDIDDLAVFSRRLSPAEINILMTAGPCALP